MEYIDYFSENLYEGVVGIRIKSVDRLERGEKREIVNIKLYFWEILLWREIVVRGEMREGFKCEKDLKLWYWWKNG